MPVRKPVPASGDLYIARTITATDRRVAAVEQRLRVVEAAVVGKRSILDVGNWRLSGSGLILSAIYVPTGESTALAPG